MEKTPQLTRKRKSRNITNYDPVKEYVHECGSSTFVGDEKNKAVCVATLARRAAVEGDSPASQQEGGFPTSTLLCLELQETLEAFWTTLIYRREKDMNQTAGDTELASICDRIWNLRFQMQRLLVIACWMLIIGTANGYKMKNRIPKNPEARMNLSQTISYWGYPNEQYDIVTEDGYILDLYRIPHGKGCSEIAPHRPVVYLQHGLFASAFNWIANLPPNSLAYVLADAGCDVWLGNSRGSTWSRRHVSLSPDSEEFWAFSFDEMANYDLPATIDFIVKKTRQKQLYYLGHSQGTTIAFVSFSTNPKLSQRIKMFFGLAPVASVKHTKSPPKKLFPFLESLVKVLFNNKDMFSQTKFKQFLATDICTLQIFHWLCKDIFLYMYGSDYRNLNESRLDVYMANFPAGASVQNLVHWGQLISSGQLQAFDWKNPALNMEHYNQVTPPLYNVTLMKVPTLLWSGGEDTVADPLDVDSWLPNISNLIYHKRIPYYNHMDFYLGMDAPQQVFYELVSIIKKNMQT
ncbi:LOW QUALITY PROTEIN: lipase member K-like [Dromiciops gliroides]|uniref:LOW QUALITY PROTEIN: lipase member K-like n=1 Tax=Dromiciops gliroides TaxID=33562 RepID=UPI001CC6A079|nr:LOW QUALITY PROTEIN: lipase member K-like [Dromiciops gliroides]